MTDPGLEAQIGAARAYEALFVPALFGQWAARVAEAARLSVGEPNGPLVVAVWDGLERTPACVA